MNLNNKSFLNREKPLLTVMVQAEKPDRIKELIDKSTPLGAEAFGMQFEKLSQEFKNEKTLCDLFSYTDKPLYITNYRNSYNENKSDDVLGEELLSFADFGNCLLDVMADYFDRQPGEFTMDESAVEKQINLINSLHEKGAEVIMSSHILSFTPPERVLEIALEHQRRGVDISKIVVGADTPEEQIENLKIINLLKKNLKIPFLLLSSGECHVLRRINGELGCCMYLCVYEHDELATKEQPLLRKMKLIRDNMI